MVTAVVGANWGDEGKGKITDMLGEESDIIVRFQGGSNAGHTIVNDYGKFALHILPSGVFYNHTTSIIGNGVALNIPDLFREINDIVNRGVPKPKILVSDLTTCCLINMRKSVWLESHLALQNQELRHSILINMRKSVYRFLNCSTKKHFAKKSRESVCRKM